MILDPKEIIKDWLGNNFHPGVLAGIGFGIATYFIMGEMNDQMSELGFRLHSETANHAITMSYSFMNTMLGYGLYERWRLRKQFNNFLKSIDEKRDKSLKARLKSLEVKAWSGLVSLLTVGLPQHQRIVEASEKDIPKLVVDLAYDAIPLAFILYYGAKAFEKDKANRTIKMIMGHFHATYGMQRQALKHYEKANQAYPSFFNHMLIAKKCSELGNIEDALINIKMGLDITRDDPIQTDLGKTFYFTTGMAHSYRKARRKVKKNPLDLAARLEMFATEYLLQNRREAAAELDEAERIAPDDIDLKLLKAQFMEQEYDFSSSEGVYREIIDGLLDEGHNFERIGETVNPVLEYKPRRFIRRSLVFKKSKLDDIVAEIELGKKAKGIAEQHGFKVPQPIGHFEKDEEHYSVQKRSPGSRLLDVGTFEDYLNAARFIGLMHAKMPRDSAKGKEDIEGKIKSKLYDDNLGLDKKTAAHILWNIEPVAKALKDAVHVYNGDFHPENFLLNPDGTLEGIDWEDKGLVPMAFDLVNLLEYRRSFTWNRKKQIIVAYLDEYNRHSNEADIRYERFELMYLNSVIPRAISLCAAWSQPHRKSSRKFRQDIIDNATDSIDIIKALHPEYHSKHHEKYENLRQSLQKLSRMIYHEH